MSKTEQTRLHAAARRARAALRQPAETLSHLVQFRRAVKSRPCLEIKRGGFRADGDPGDGEPISTSSSLVSSSRRWSTGTAESRVQAFRMRSMLRTALLAVCLLRRSTGTPKPLKP